MNIKCVNLNIINFCFKKKCLLNLDMKSDIVILAIIFLLILITLIYILFHSKRFFFSYYINKEISSLKRRSSTKVLSKKKKRNDFKTKINNQPMVYNSHYLNQFFDQIYVITLPNRQEYIQDVMEQMSIEYIFHPATLKDNIHEGELINNGFLSQDHQLNLGQIACHVSHIKVLNKFLMSPFKNCLIFEDDISISNDIKFKQDDLYKILNSIPSDYDLIYLGRCWDNCLKSTQINQSVIKCYAPQCRHAYGVSRMGARKIISLTRGLKFAGDLTISNHVKSGKLIAYAPIKSIFFQNRKQLGSNLNNYNVQKVCV